MPDLPTIALVGDYSPEVVAHQAIPRALELAGRDVGARVAWAWVHTRGVRDAPRDLAKFAGIWVVPASPYENMAGALAAIRWARETKKPFLGTCGGFQHALIEFARNVAGLGAAGHAESNPDGDTLVVTRLGCSLMEKSGDVQFTPGSRLQQIYGRPVADERYRCNYGLNPAYAAALEKAGMQFTAHDANGEIRGAELPAALHPFFLGTLFQPERAALRGETPPLARAFVAAVTAE